MAVLGAPHTHTPTTTLPRTHLEAIFQPAAAAEQKQTGLYLLIKSCNGMWQRNCGDR